MSSYENLIDAAIVVRRAVAEENEERRQSLKTLGDELRLARKFANLQEGASAAMQSIAGSVAGHVATLEAQAEQTRDELAVGKARFNRLERVVKLLEDGLQEGRAPTDAEITPIVHQLVADNGGLTYEEVYGLVKDGRTDQEASSIGLGLRVRTALTSPSLEQDAQGTYRVVKAAPQATLKPTARVGDGR